MSNDERMPNDETQIAKRVNDLSSFGLCKFLRHSSIRHLAFVILNLCDSPHRPCRGESFRSCDSHGNATHLVWAIRIQNHHADWERASCRSVADESSF